MTIHLHREVEKLKTQLLVLCAMVEENVRMAFRAFKNRDLEMAKKVIQDDHIVDQHEVDLEEECLKTLALYQPVAADLRFIVAILKINNDLERIGDLAVNMAIRASIMMEQEELEIPEEIHLLAEKSQSMLSNSLDALINMDTDKAFLVCAADDEVDAIHRKMYRYTEDRIREKISGMRNQVILLDISHHLERIADHATNIAEDVIYMVQGRIIRHGRNLDSRRPAHPDGITF